MNIFRFLSTSLWILVDNLSEIYNKKCKRCKERKKTESACNLIRLKYNKLHYKCKECEKRQLKQINGLVKTFSNIYQFCNGDINNFVLLLRKGGYPYEYMNSWETFGKTLLPDKKSFYSVFNLEILLIKTTYTYRKYLKF